MRLPIELVSYLISSFIEKEHLIDLFQLLDKYLLPILVSRLKCPHHAHHETLVYLVIPGVKRIGIWIIVVRERKGATKGSQKAREKKLPVQLFLGLLSQLHEHQQVLALLDSLIPIFLPPVFKVSFQASSKFLRDRLVIVELLKHTEEAYKLFALVQIIVEGAELLDN